MLIVSEDVYAPVVKLDISADPDYIERSPRELSPTPEYKIVFDEVTNRFERSM